MKKHLMVVLISVDDFTNGRKIAEEIENQNFKTPNDVLSKVREKEDGFVGICPISDFMDACNNQDVFLEGVWISYVYVEEY